MRFRIDSTFVDTVDTRHALEWPSNQGTFTMGTEVFKGVTWLEAPTLPRDLQTGHPEMKVQVI